MKKVLKSFGYAMDGVELGFSERNFKVHCFVAFLVIIFGIYFKITQTEWILIFFCFGLVFALELVNSAIEELANNLRDELKLAYLKTKACRDLSAGAVLVAAFFSALVGLQIFLPRFFQF